MASPISVRSANPDTRGPRREVVEFPAIEASRTSCLAWSRWGVFRRNAQQERDRSVVHQMDLHVRAEAPSLYRADRAVARARATR
jgi:hypothetical protein